MKDIIQAVQDRLAAISDLKYIDEDWGQLDDYSPNFPVKWPLALIEVRNAVYTNIGRERGQPAAENRQMATATIVVTIAALRLTNTSKQAPQLQKDNVWNIWNIIGQVHDQLHGHRPVAYSSALIRQQLTRKRRDDGITQYEVSYSLGLTGV